VDKDATGSNDGSSWTDAYTSLQAAITAASSGEIWVADGTYYPTGGTDRTIAFGLKNGVAIYGGFDGAETAFGDRDWTTNVTILSGDIGTPSDATDNSYHVVIGSGTDDTAILDGFTITAGNANGSTDDIYSGGGMYNYTGSPTLANLIFNANSATSGGGIYNFSSSPGLTNITFSTNSATSGGGMYNNNSSPTPLNVTFSANTATGNGGGMYNGNTSNPSLTTVTFSSNTAGLNGGGIYNIETSNSTLTTVTFSGNTAADYGGGMYNAHSNPTLTSVTFSANTATTNDGGGLCSLASNPTLTNVTFNSNNHAGGRGGGMYSEGGSPTLSTVTFSANTAASYGGGMFNYNSSPTLTNVTFNNINHAGLFGGGMYNYNSSPILNTVTFNGNTATQNGGGMLNDGSSPTLMDVTFDSNSAGWGGGGMFNANTSNPSLANVTFNANTATGGGGGMGNYYSSPTLTNVTFSGNTAANDGGGMRNENSSPTLTNVTFSGNTATLSGGGVYNIGCSPTLTNVTFSGNTAAGGGGMYNESNSSPSLTNVTISGNTISTTNGGGMFNNVSSNPAIRDSILWGNSTTTGGGSVNNVGNSESAPVIDDSIVEGGCPTDATCNTNVLNSDPLLGPLTNNGGFTRTMALGTGSPAMEAGNDATCEAVDQRGVTRPQDPHCDMGAYEAPDTLTPSVVSITLADSSPTALANADFTVTFSESVTGVDDASDFALTTTGVTGASVTTISGSGKTYTVTVNTGTGDGTIRLGIPDTATIKDLASRSLGGLPYIGGETYTIDKSLAFISTGSKDGWVLESSKTSKVGGSISASSTNLRIGDDAAKKQYRSILSFSTGASLPDTAIITKVTLKIRKQSIVGGGNPITAFQGFMVDIRRGYFGTSTSLQSSDFQAVLGTTGKAYGPFKPSLVGGWYSIILTSGKNYINKVSSYSGLTQIRLRFKLDDNNNTTANYLSLYSGNAGTSYRPQLIIEYYIP
jgi:predicted outer membrane repeat protein